ncbi:hypothetical protein GPECTOR_77g10 [Gonium pectorale]|uniref:Expansin-like EG45 domain-containing protein n=1 Tax=Gonium pectorale TaxID=33097 RepID=A0A150G261_GONPE|nr:hypothetical protein GPECTOR_77g10 [Gonium pectorale]|eukprot:KXZ43913.1 hypothetical protein GPECTOR_77g10 [Gonium pectorale]
MPARASGRLLLLAAAVAAAALLLASPSPSWARSLSQVAAEDDATTEAPGGNETAAGGNSSDVDLGPWKQGTNFSVPVTAKAFRFGASGQNVTLAENFCGYGPLSSPYVVGISPDSPLTKRLPLSGCGACLEVVCAAGSPACVHPDATDASLTPASAPGPTDAEAASNVLAPGRLLLRVADQCRTCGPLDLNLHYDAFAQLADTRVGVANLTYRYVTCPSLGRKISVYVNAFRPSEGGWLRLSVRDVAGDGLAEVAITRCPRAGPSPSPSPRDGGAASPAGSAAGRGGGGSAAGGIGGGGGLTPGCAGTLRGPSWRIMQNTVGAQWEYAGLPRLPFDLRLTDVAGQEIIVWNAITNTTAPAVYETHAQFAPPPPPGAEEEGVYTGPNGR